MVGVKLSQDCYFYLNSTCSKAENCYFRHEPQAKLTDTVCYYWQTSECTRYQCPYRHSEVKSGYTSRATSSPRPQEHQLVSSIENKINKPCFWDGQPSGCIKTNCQYIHTSRESSSSRVNQDVRTSTGQQISSGSIILNQQKLQALKNVIPISDHGFSEDLSKPRRVVVPPGAGILARREITGGIKSRLGISSQVKSRLGSKGEDTSLVSDESRDLSPDLEIIEELRTSALKTIDLRKRIENKIARKSESPEIIKYESDSDQRRGKSKKIKKEKREEKDKRKKRKSDEKAESVYDRLGAKEDLPSASDYSDLDTPAGSPDPRSITVMTKTAGMYADTGAVSQSAKIRLGKRKKAELDLSMRPRRGSLDVSVDRNPSPPPPASQQPSSSTTEMSDLSSIKRTVVNTPSRSPSPLIPGKVTTSITRVIKRSRSASPAKSASLPPLSPSTKRLRSSTPSPGRKKMKKKDVPESTLMAEEIFMAVKQNILDKNEKDLVKKKKSKEGKTKKSKKSKKSDGKESKKKKNKKSAKRKRSNSASSSSPSPLPQSPKRQKQKSRKRDKKDGTKHDADDQQDLDQVEDGEILSQEEILNKEEVSNILPSPTKKKKKDKARKNSSGKEELMGKTTSNLEDTSLLSDAELMKQVDEFIKN